MQLFPSKVLANLPWAMLPFICMVAPPARVLKMRISKVMTGAPSANKQKFAYLDILDDRLQQKYTAFTAVLLKLCTYVYNLSKVVAGEL